MYTPENYFEMYRMWKYGEISTEMWTTYCLDYLQKIMEGHKDVFIRLKNR